MGKVTKVHKNKSGVIKQESLVGTLKEVERIFVFNHNLGLSDAILIHSWFKDCCQFAVDTTSEILDNHKSKN